MPQIRVLRKSDVILARADRQHFQTGRSNEIVKIRIRDNLNSMPARSQCSAEANHWVNVAVAAQSGDDEVRHRERGAVS
jgi:hypothetical protein